MPLAGDDTIIAINGAIRLRASLRAALRLEQRFGGFRSLLQDLLNGSVTALVAILVECGDHPRPHELVTAPAPETWADRFERITPALVAFVLDLADINPGTADTPKVETSGPKVTLAEAYRQIFGIATGILGWSPAVAWSATVPEIMAALDQHAAMVRAQNGIPDPKPAGPDNAPLDHVGLAELAAMADAA